MSGRGVWWEVRLEKGVLQVLYTQPDGLNKKPVRWQMGIDEAIAQMVKLGHVDAIAAALECPDDRSFQEELAKLR